MMTSIKKYLKLLVRDSAKAKAIYWQARVKLQPRSPMLLYHYGQYLWKTQQLDQAESAFHQALQYWSNCSTFYQTLGDFYKEQKKIQLAKEAYQAAIQWDAQAHWSYYHLGELEFNQQNWQAAIEVLSKAAQLNPQFPYTFMKLGLAYMRVQNWVAAQANFQLVIKLAPENFDAYFQLAAVLTQQNLNEQAADVYLNMIDLDPTFSWTYYYYFWTTLRKTQRIEQAVTRFQTALQKQPNKVPIYLNLGEAILHCDRIPDALPIYQAGIKTKIAQTKPDYPLNLWNQQPALGPNFIILGAQKAGTSSLYEYMIQHPQILPTLKKELEFWSWRMRRGLDWYRAQFPPIPETSTYLTGEACPGYLDYYEAAERLKQEFPQVKLIVILRDPVDRAYSHYHHWVRRNQEKRDFETVIAEQLHHLQTQLQVNGNDQCVWNDPHNYVARGLYSIFLKQWLDIFSNQQLLVLKSEEFYQFPGETLANVYKFLDLPNHNLANYPKLNSGYYQPISDSTRQQLQEFYQPYNQALQSLLGRSFNW